MPARRKPSRGPHIIWRTRKDGPARAYADFRAFPGGQREALVAPGEAAATTDPITAQELFAKRLRALEDATSTGTGVAGVPNGRRATLAQAVAGFLDYKRTRNRATAKWVDELATMLGRAVAHFGPDRRLATITPDDVVGWLDALATVRHPKGTGYSEQSRRHHLTALSQVFKRGQRAGWVPPSYSATALLESEERPKVPESTTGFLEIPEAARLLEAARTYPRSTSEPRMVLAYPILATFLLAGLRCDECLGLEVADLDFAARVIRVRPTVHRRGAKGKTAGATRVVPMFPQLETALREYLSGAYIDFLTRDPSLTLLFPSPKTLGRITDIRDLVDKPAARAGLPVGIYRQREFRVTYITHRLQTTEGGEPVAPLTVAREAGHTSLAMVERVYARLGSIRHRSPVLEYVVPECGATTGAHGHPLTPAHREN